MEMTHSQIGLRKASRDSHARAPLGNPHTVVHGHGLARNEGLLVREVWMEDVRGWAGKVLSAWMGRCTPRGQVIIDSVTGTTGKGEKQKDQEGAAVDVLGQGVAQKHEGEAEAPASQLPQPCFSATEAGSTQPNPVSECGSLHLHCARTCSSHDVRSSWAPRVCRSTGT